MADADSSAAIEEAKRGGALHADLVLWEDADRRARQVREQGLQDPRITAVTRAYWIGFATRMERHAAALGQKLKQGGNGP
jgi:hypothetical protein